MQFYVDTNNDNEMDEITGRQAIAFINTGNYTVELYEMDEPHFILLTRKAVPIGGKVDIKV